VGWAGLGKIVVEGQKGRLSRIGCRKGACTEWVRGEEQHSVHWQPETLRPQICHMSAGAGPQTNEVELECMSLVGLRRK
tara:strand:+ start:241 stop:477 length:237 start_codon:yes stop_codon:yes gene_type:complete